MIITQIEPSHTFHFVQLFTTYLNKAFVHTNFTSHLLKVLQIYSIENFEKSKFINRIFNFDIQFEFSHDRIRNTPHICSTHRIKIVYGTVHRFRQSLMVNDNSNRCIVWPKCQKLWNTSRRNIDRSEQLAKWWMLRAFNGEGKFVQQTRSIVEDKCSLLSPFAPCFTTACSRSNIVCPACVIVCVQFRGQRPALYSRFRTRNRQDVTRPIRFALFLCVPSSLLQVCTFYSRANVSPGNRFWIKY